MTDLIVPEAGPLVSIPGVELCAAGTWKISTGETTFTIADLAECVAALDCPGVRNPVLKLGHDETDGPGVRWDGEPALGWVDNMALSGAKLIGDLAGVPSWLAEVMPSAYPDRSVEMYRPFVCQVGHSHPAVITALALLGVSGPGVGVLKSLQDVAALYQVDPPPAQAVSRARAVLVDGQVYLAAAPTTPTLRRQLTDVEKAAKTDFLGLQTHWQDRLHDLAHDWTDVVSQMRDALTEQIEAAIDADRLDALAELFADADDAADLLGQAMEDEANDAAEEMQREAERQGVFVVLGDIDKSRLREIARTSARLLAETLAVTAGRRAVHVATPAATGAQVAADVADHLAGLSDRWLLDQLGGALSNAEATGRFAVLEAAPQAEYYASEVLDTNTCEACAEMDGYHFADLDEALAAYAAGGFIDCEGGLRCRGIVVTVWNADLAAAARDRVTVTVPLALRVEGRHEGHRIRLR